MSDENSEIIRILKGMWSTAQEIEGSITHYGESMEKRLKSIENKLSDIQSDTSGIESNTM
ncbi:MAG: hypothetical protein GWP14_06900 [Actinobacteria bacterium]|nr:hypothetical protein [Actinomycetota bacterium]